MKETISHTEKTDLFPGGEGRLAGVDFEILSLAMLIANDIIPFDRHHVYVRGEAPDALDGRWHYLQGFVLSREFPYQSRIENYRRIHNKLFESDHPTFEAHHQRGRAHACYARFKLRNRVTGYLAVKRQQAFSKIEHVHLALLSKLVEGAHDEKSILQLLQRLHLVALDRRTLLQASRPQEILTEYLAKAMHLCHHKQRQSLEACTPGEPREIVRATAKLVTPNRTALRIAATFSTRPSEWTRKRKATVYTLARKDSIAARVYETGKEFWTNNYRQHKNAKILFKDAQCHISVPIVAGDLDRLGVFAIQTTAPEAYDEYVAAAFTLLGAHAAWPLERSLNREYASRRTQEFKIVASTMGRLQKASNEAQIFEAMSAGLSQLGFKRGLICRVDHERREIFGINSWGGEQMKRVKQGTLRHFARDAGDCQVIAVQQGRHVLIKNPETDPRTHRDAFERGNLKPFGIFPIFDNHGEVAMTAHVEREDGVPLGSSDVSLVRQLCAGATNAIEQVLHRGISKDWIADIIINGYTSGERLLRRFCEFVTKKHLVRRSRVFRVTDNDKQVGLCQSGTLPAKDFEEFTLNRRSGLFLQKLRETRKPLLVRRAALSYSVEPTEEFEVFPVCRVEHERRLRKEDGSEWIEAPTFQNGKIVAKVVFDHADRTDDRFTLSELQLLATLCKTTSLACEAASSQELRSLLCREGGVASLHRHRLCGCLDPLVHENRGRYFRTHLDEALKSIRRLNKLFRTAGGARTTTLAEEVREAEKLIRPWQREDIELSICPSLPEMPLPESNYALTLILLVLLENAIAAVERAKKSRDVERVIHVDVREVSGPAGMRVRVFDYGVRVPKNVAETFDFPPVLLGNRAKMHGNALVYARVLASEMGWKLELTQWKKRPTVFDLVINV